MQSLEEIQQKLIRYRIEDEEQRLAMQKDFLVGLARTSRCRTTRKYDE